MWKLFCGNVFFIKINIINIYTDIDKYIYLHLHYIYKNLGITNKLWAGKIIQKVKLFSSVLTKHLKRVLSRHQAEILNHLKVTALIFTAEPVPNLCHMTGHTVGRCQPTCNTSIMNRSPSHTYVGQVTFKPRATPKYITWTVGEHNIKTKFEYKHSSINTSIVQSSAFVVQSLWKEHTLFMSVQTHSVKHKMKHLAQCSSCSFTSQ